MGWNKDMDMSNPARVLKEYYGAVKDFANKAVQNKKLEAELDSEQNRLKVKSDELNGLKDELESMGTYTEGDVDAALQAAADNAQKKIDSETKKYDFKKKEILDKRDKDIRENDSWLKNRMTELIGENADLNKELTEMEKKALEYEAARRQFNVASNEKINEYEDAIVEEQLACQTLIGELKSDQDSIYEKYEPDLTRYGKLIDSVNKKYQPDIKNCQNAVSEKAEKRNDEIGQLQNERNREIQLANSEIEGYQRDFRQTEKQFNEQIRMAKFQNKPTTRMENSKVSRLNAINDQIQKINHRLNKKMAGIDQKIEAAQSRHAKLIEKAENQLNTVIHNKDQELSGLTKTYNGLLRDRDGQIAALQLRIDQRERECDTRINGLNADIAAKRQAQNDNDAKIDQQIIEYVMSGETCFSDVLTEETAPFIALQERIDVWMKMLSDIKKGRMASAYPAEHEKQRQTLLSKNYSELQNELAEATQYNDQLSVFSRNNGILSATGGLLTALGVVLMIVLYAILKMPVGLACIAITAMGIALIILTIFKTNGEFALLCKYVSLASDYREFSGVTSYSTQVAQDRELARMKLMGDKLYGVHYGRTEAQNIHDAKDVDIKADYERNLKLITKEFENSRDQIQRDLENEIKNIKEAAADGENNFNEKKENIQNQISLLTAEVDRLEGKILETERELDDNSGFMEAFENNYRIFEKQLQNDKWFTPMSDTKGKLSNLLYIIPDNGESDEYGHKKIYRIVHNKKAMVVNYDISGVSDGKIENINKIIQDLMYDLMYAVYRMNSRETYVQFIVNEMACTNDLKRTNIKNTLNIVEVADKLEEIRGRIKNFAELREKLAQKGMTMDEVNESRFSLQDRPETYNILYIIYKPDERKGKLDDEIRILGTECDKFGFFPVFICEKDTWERGIQENESMYRDIKNLANSTIVVYDGKTYSIRR